MENIINKNNSGEELNIGHDILNSNIRNKELINWLNLIEKNKIY